MNCCSRKCSKIESTHSLSLNIFPSVMLKSLPPVEAPVMAPKIMSSIGMPIRGSRTEKHYFFIWRVLHVHWIQVTLAYFFIQAHIYVHCSIVHVFCRQRNIDFWAAQYHSNFHDCDVSLQRSHCNQWTFFLAIVLLQQKCSFSKIALRANLAPSRIEFLMM